MRTECSSTQIHRLSRRSFLLQAGGLTLALAFGTRPVDAIAQLPNKPPKPFDLHRPNVWVTIGADDRITLISPASEMGQGVMTSIPLLIAEEMDADWNKVKVLQAPNAKAYGNPKFGGAQATGGSQTTRAFFDPLRLVGAQTRNILIASASAMLGAPIDELTTEPNVVVHRATERKLSYGEIAANGRIPDPIPQVTLTDLKPATDWRYLGKDLPRIDIPSKVDGSACFGTDLLLPGMLYGAVARPPVQGEVPISIDDTAARPVRGVRKIVPLPYGVGVVADDPWAAMKARNALKITWSTRSRAREYSSDQVLTEYQALASGELGNPLIVVARGDAPSAVRSAFRVMTSTYVSEHVHQATMEPPNATALVSKGRVDVWGPFQEQTVVESLAAEITGAPFDDIAIHTTLLGGGFGRKYETDFARDALSLANAVPGQPVKVIWTREDDMQHAKYRPLEAQFVRIGLDRAGQIIAWHHRIVADSITARYHPDQFKKMGGLDPSVTEGIDFNYDVPGLLAEYVRVDRGVDVGFWRAVGPGYTKFAVECMLDEIASSTAADPLETRLRLLHREPRAQRVLQAVAEMSAWTKRRREMPKGAPIGIAYSDAFGSYCAQVAEIAANRDTGEIRVLNVWCAVDPGPAMQPANIQAQIMSGIVFGISHCLHEQITFVNGEVQQANFNDYRVLRMSEIPDIHVQVLDSPLSPPGGIGEAGVPPIGAAIANAFAAVTGGVRLRHYPFVPERVKAALNS
jgi:isoquinoline 1-oxidoreductase beta subunit